MKKVLFICTGNTCRSPMAEALLKHHSNNELEVQSAGLFASFGSPANKHAVEVLAEKGITIDHQSQPLSAELVQWADLILTMTTNHKRMLHDQYPQSIEKAFALKEYLSEVSGKEITGDSFTNRSDISDPFGGSVEVYRQTLQELEELIQQLKNNMI
jgi:protein-tyrosine-phosphatase